MNGFIIFMAKYRKLILWNIGSTLREPTFPKTPKEQTLLPGVAYAISELSDFGHVGISNQGGVTATNPDTGEPYTTLENVQKNNQEILVNLAPKLEAIYFCTHWGGGGTFCYRQVRSGKLGSRLIIEDDVTNKPYRMPNPGMLYAALERFGSAYLFDYAFVGDLESNEEAAERAKKRYPDLQYFDVNDFLIQQGFKVIEPFLKN